MPPYSPPLHEPSPAMVRCDPSGLKFRLMSSWSPTFPRCHLGGWVGQLVTCYKQTKTIIPRYLAPPLQCCMCLASFFHGCSMLAPLCLCGSLTRLHMTATFFSPTFTSAFLWLHLVSVHGPLTLIIRASDSDICHLTHLLSMNHPWQW